MLRTELSRKADGTYSATVQKNASGCRRGLLLAVRKRNETLSTRACCLKTSATTLVAGLLSCKPQSKRRFARRRQVLSPDFSKQHALMDKVSFRFLTANSKPLRQPEALFRTVVEYVLSAFPDHSVRSIRNNKIQCAPPDHPCSYCGALRLFSCTGPAAGS